MANVTEEQAYDRDAFESYLKGLMEERNESMRSASLAAGLDHGALYRYITEHRRPTRESCIALADHFGLNPNEMLTRAGYPPMRFFDRSLEDPKAHPPYVEELASYLSRIEPQARRRELCRAIRRVVELAAGDYG